VHSQQEHIASPVQKYTFTSCTQGQPCV